MLCLAAIITTSAWHVKQDGGDVSYLAGGGNRMSLSVDWNLWGVLLFASILELAGDLALKWWAETSRWPGLAIGLVLYGVSLILFAHLLRRAKLAVLFALWVGVAAILLTFAGWWLFGEALSLRHLAGLALVVAGVMLLQT
jgi:multidrug transporter EmrE-like cation transporter